MPVVSGTNGKAGLSTLCEEPLFPGCPGPQQPAPRPACASPPWAIPMRVQSLMCVLPFSWTLSPLYTWCCLGLLQKRNHQRKKHRHTKYKTKLKCRGWRPDLNLKWPPTSAHFPSCLVPSFWYFEGCGVMRWGYHWGQNSERLHQLSVQARALSVLPLHHMKKRPQAPAATNRATPATPCLPQHKGLTAT